MWTPRRILLLLLGVGGFVGVYATYAAFLGGIDGLPQLPPEYYPTSGPQQIPTPPDQPDSPTYVRLREAFGSDSHEVTDPVAYKNRFEDRNRGTVYALGQPVINGTAEVTVTPFSVAFFGKPKPAHLRALGEATEVTTFHADQAVLEFDRPVSSAQQLTDAKMIGMKLVGMPEMPSNDPRKGQIWVTNNQRSANPGDALVFRTPGPLYYESPEHPARKNPAAPHVWTHASVEVVDLRNLPRPLRAPPPRPVPLLPEHALVASARSDSLRNRTAIADILLGSTLPPPTVTANGMNVFLEQKPASPRPQPAGPRQNTTGFTGVKAVELRENVQLCTWSDGGAGLPGASAADTPLQVAVPDPPFAAGAILGALSDAHAVSRTLDRKTLLVAETLGTFRYDFEANTARFQSAPSAPDAVANFVTVARLSARGRQDDLSCKTLVVEFDAGPDRSRPGASAGPASSGGMKVKHLTATGAHVYVSFEGEQLTALGHELRHSVDAKTRVSTTILKGSPVNAVRGRNKLLAGSKDTPAEVVILTTEPPLGSKEKKHTTMSVNGRGRMDIYDEASGNTTLQATWGRSLTHEKERVGEIDQDLLKFEGGGSFVDARGNMRLTADQLWLWLAPGAGDESKRTKSANASEPSKALPQRLRATGHVDGNSADMMIENTDLLTVWFRDVPPPADSPPGSPATAVRTLAPAATPSDPITQVAAAQPTPETVPPPQVPIPAIPPEALVGPLAPPPPAKPPMHISARLVESWMVRYPVKAVSSPSGPGQPLLPANATTTRLKYEMERSRCEDRVVVHQDPENPAKSPVGVYIAGARLNLDQSKAGSVMTVYGADPTWAQVHYESLSLFGPIVVIDQPNNAASIDGRGMLRMPGETDSADPAKKPTDLEIQWAKSMRFRGTNGTGATAAFVGQVQTVQMPNRPAIGPRVDLAPGAQAKHTALRANGGRPEDLTAPRPASAAAAVAPANPPSASTWDRTVVLCHQLDVTFDRPIYFNDRKPGAKGTTSAKKDAERAKLKTALCTPMSDDEAVQFHGLPVKRVVYQTDTFDRSGRPVEARRVEAKQIDLRRDDKEQRVYAAGPGEVRILQPGAKDEFGAPPPSPGQQTPSTAQEMKLTVVKFLSRMDGTEKAGLYRDAVFHDGARVFRVPTTDLALRFAEHAPPPRTTVLECTERLTVSSATATRGGPPDQQMVADGNAEFRTEEYEGSAPRIVYRESAVTLQGVDGRLARLRKTRRSVTDTDHWAAVTIVYHRDGRVDVGGGASGSITAP